MTSFKFKFEWDESPRARTPEHAATWARVEIHAGGEIVTKVEVRRTGHLRTGIYIPLFPLAEWITANWWFLLEEWTPHSADRQNLSFAKEGFSLPNLTFTPTETKVELCWKPDMASIGTVNFLLGGSTSVDKTCIREEFSSLVDAVLEQLTRKGLTNQGPGQFLLEEWAAIRAAESDPAERAFCQHAARLGCDPFDTPGEIAAQLEQIGTVLPQHLLEDYCDAIAIDQLSAGAATVKTFIDAAHDNAPAEGQWPRIRTSVRWASSQHPWKEGYSQANSLRSYLSLNGQLPINPEYLLRESLGSLQVVDFAALSRIQAIAAPSATTAPVFGIPSQMREEQRHFSLCRALSDYLSSASPSLVTRSQTEHQQRNRAFAAQFLAPAEAIQRQIGNQPVDDDLLYELSREFNVSELVVRHQIQNHNLAALAL